MHYLFASILPMALTQGGAINCSPFVALVLSAALVATVVFIVRRTARHANRGADRPAELQPTLDQVQFRQLTTLDDPAVNGLIKVYQSAFAGPPYFETYSDEYVLQHVVIPHLPYFIGIAELSGEVVGFACAFPAMSDVDPAQKEFLLSNQHLIPFDLRKASYSSELGALKTVRRMGLGRALVRWTYKWAHDNGYEYYVLKTAENGSNSRGIIEREGGILLPFVQEAHGEIQSASERRIWFYGKTDRFADFTTNS